jgi:hypothetical protein
MTNCYRQSNWQWYCKQDNQSSVISHSVIKEVAKMESIEMLRREGLSMTKTNFVSNFIQRL